jgi:hypothetical protein
MKNIVKLKKVRIYIPNGHENGKSNNGNEERFINNISASLARDYGGISIFESMVLHQNEFHEIWQERAKILEFVIPENHESRINKITQDVKSKLNQKPVFMDTMDSNQSLTSEQLELSKNSVHEGYDEESLLEHLRDFFDLTVIKA